MSKSLRELADLVGGKITGDPEVLVSGVADIADAEPGDIVFAESPKFVEEALESQASAVITFENGLNFGKPMIIVSNPRYAFAQVIREFSPVKNREIGIHPTSFMGASATVGKDSTVGFNAYVGQNTVIGDDVWIHPLAYIGDNVRIGNGCVIHPFVSIHDNISLGNNVIIHSGAVIGADGFGYARVGNEHYKMPQVGTVIIEDDVEIGANVTIDRARTGKTRIGRGTKIDNLVQIGHNVTVGENCIIVAQVGVSGSVVLGNRVVLAGQVGLKDHVTVGDDAIVCAQSGVMGDVRAGAFVSGYMARPHKEQMKVYAAQQKLPALLQTVKDLERRINELESRSE